ncbi:MAG: hypothetical protein ACYTG7_06180 [Planctomycetota bacterium]|jgi:hypothetical protein
MEKPLSQLSLVACSLLIGLFGLLISCSSGGGGGSGGTSSQGQTNTKVSTLVIMPSLADEIIMEKPVERLLSALKRFGYGKPDVQNDVPENLPDRTLIVGEIDETNIKLFYNKAKIKPPDLVTDAFLLDVLALGEDRRIGIVTGKGPRGVVYAIYELIRRLTMNSDSFWDGLSVKVAPTLAVRYTAAYSPPNEKPVDTELMDPAEILRMGYNGIVLYGLTNLCTFDDYDPDLFDPDFYGPHWPADLRGMVEEDRAYIDELYKEAKAYHLEVFLDGDMLVVPSTAFIKYEEEITHDDEEYDDMLCPGKDKVFEIIEATIDEIFKWFPELDGIQIRLGEVYSYKQTIFGNSPTQGDCPSCDHMDDEDKLRRVTEQIRLYVIENHKRRFNQRAWGYLDTWHAHVDKYLAVSDPIPLDERLTFSFKQTRTDYWRYNALNPNFGQGLHGQWAEFQCQREYEGKGSFPLYMGRYFAEGGKECDAMGLRVGGLKDLVDLGIKGGWGWCRGGGWGGPIIEREEWVALNDYALGRLFWNPRLDPYAIAREWLALTLGERPLKKLENAFVKILELNEKAMLGARYVKPYAEGGYVGKSYGWKPCENWMRDDRLDGKALKIAEKLYDTIELDEAIAEKQEVLALANDLMNQWENIIKQVDPGDDFWTELYNTAVYGDSLLRISAHYFLAVFHYVQWKNSPTSEAQEAALFHLAEWQERWDEHLNQIPALKGVATPFKDKGMVDLCNIMHDELTR